jgi:uncharacterized protein YacL
MLNNLCAPTLIYIVFSLTQVLIDMFKGLYNTALFKFIVMIMVSLLLNALCASGMSIISWLIVFIPFIFMTVVVTILLYIFGLDPATGKLSEEQELVSNTNGNLIFSRQFNINSNTNMNEEEMEEVFEENTIINKRIPNYSTDPEKI